MISMSIIYQVLNQILMCPHLPKLAEKSLSSAGLDVGNPADPRRTRSDFQRAGIYFSCSDSLFSDTCYMMIGSNPKSYYHARNDPIWQAAMD